MKKYLLIPEHLLLLLPLFNIIVVANTAMDIADETTYIRIRNFNGSMGEISNHNTIWLAATTLICYGAHLLLRLFRVRQKFICNAHVFLAMLVSVIILVLAAKGHNLLFIFSYLILIRALVFLNVLFICFSILRLVFKKPSS